MNACVVCATCGARPVRPLFTPRYTRWLALPLHISTIAALAPLWRVVLLHMAFGLPVTRPAFAVIPMPANGM